MTDDGDEAPRGESTPRETDGPRGTMADVSHTPPARTDGAADVFARGGEQLGPPPADADGPGEETASSDDRSGGEGSEAAGDGRRTDDPDDE